MTRSADLRKDLEASGQMQMRQKFLIRDEASGLAASERRSEHWDNILIRVDNCPGTTRWRLATRGFSPRSLLFAELGLVRIDDQP